MQPGNVQWKTLNENHTHFISTCNGSENASGNRNASQSFCHSDADAAAVAAAAAAAATSTAHSEIYPIFPCLQSNPKPVPNPSEPPARCELLSPLSIRSFPLPLPTSRRVATTLDIAPPVPHSTPPPSPSSNAAATKQKAVWPNGKIARNFK